MSLKSRGVAERTSRSVASQKWSLLLCLGSFCAGMLFTTRMWIIPEIKGGITRTTTVEAEKLKLVSEGCITKFQKLVSKDIFGKVSKTHQAIQTLDKTISNLEMELAAAKAAQESILSGAPISEEIKKSYSTRKRKYFMVIGINTAFSSRKRRDSVRATWMPQGEKRGKLEEEKGIIIRFVIGHGYSNSASIYSYINSMLRGLSRTAVAPVSDPQKMHYFWRIRRAYIDIFGEPEQHSINSFATVGGILDRAIEAEDKKHGDFLRLDHIEGYLELSAKTKTYFATAVKLWDAEYYIKVDDDVHVNIATLGEILARHRKKPRIYIGCMKSGPVLSRKGVRYHEPEYWKFGDKYFRHATGQIYAISKDLASYISVNQHVLHKYTNEDVSLGAWFIGLDVQHIDDRRLCCGTPPDCEWKAQAGNICVASFDWTCSGICRSVDRIKEVHRRCGEGENALWKAAF